MVKEMTTKIRRATPKQIDVGGMSPIQHLCSWVYVTDVEQERGDIADRIEEIRFDLESVYPDSKQIMHLTKLAKEIRGDK